MSPLLTTFAGSSARSFGHGRARVRNLGWLPKQTYTSSTTYIVSEGTIEIAVFVISGGFSGNNGEGAGGYASGSGGAGGAGGRGAAGKSAVTAGANYVITIGGTSGGDSSIGGILSSDGSGSANSKVIGAMIGTGGGRGASGGNGGNGVTGGGGSAGGTLTLSGFTAENYGGGGGGGGGAARFANDEQYYGGGGGGSPNGGGGAGQIRSAITGNSVTTGGAGGAGGAGTRGAGGGGGGGSASGRVYNVFIGYGGGDGGSSVGTILLYEYGYVD